MNVVNPLIVAVFFVGLFASGFFAGLYVSKVVRDAPRSEKPVGCK